MKHVSRSYRRIVPPTLFASLFALACSAGGEKQNDRPGLDVDSGLTDDASAVDGGDGDTGSFVVPDTGTPSPDAILDPDAGCASAEAAATKQPVDIIMIIDQSGSMDAESVQVQNNINKLSSYLASTGLDYRVVMIAGMPGNGSLPMCVPPPLAGASCASKPPRFRAVNQHVESWDALKLILQTYDSTDPAKKWSDFLRYNAVKVFIPITDDDPDDSFIPEPVATNFDNEILKRGGGTFGTKSKRKYIFYPICGVSPGSDTTKCSSAVNTGPILVELAKMTKGKPYSVCEPSYEPVFKDIGKAIASSVACEILVPPPPAGETFDPDKVNVIYKDSGGGVTTIPRDESSECFDAANGWQYNEDKTKILLCGDHCAYAKSDPGAVITVAFGCKSVIN